MCFSESVTEIADWTIEFVYNSICLSYLSLYCSTILSIYHSIYNFIYLFFLFYRSNCRSVTSICLSIILSSIYGYIYHASRSIRFSVIILFYLSIYLIYHCVFLSIFLPTVSVLSLSILLSFYIHCSFRPSIHRSFCLSIYLSLIEVIFAINLCTSIRISQNM